MSRSTTLSVLFLLAAPAALVLADGSAGGAGCPVAQKVSSLNAGWKAATEDAKSLSAAEKEKIGARLASLAKECPIGSRVGPTLGAAKDVLAAAVAAEEAFGKACPLAAAEKAGDRSEALAEGLKLKAARSTLIHDLHQLASYASGATCNAACCAAKGEKTNASTAAPAKETSAAAADQCQKEILARVTALKASWEKAPAEAKALPAAKRDEIRAGFTAAAKESKAVELVMPSVLALADGFDALESIHGKMAEWGRANPQYLASVPEEGKKAYEAQIALFHETREVLVKARETLKGCDEACPEKGKPVTASN